VVSDNTRRQLLFAVGDHLFAADARAVREIVEPGLTATPIPGAIPAVRGLINLRGTLLVAGNLAALLDLSPRPSDPALVVFEHEARQVALEVDRVVDVTSLPLDAIDNEEDGQLPMPLAGRSVVCGAGQYDSRPYFQLDVRQLFGLVLEEQERGASETDKSDGGAGR
jgi:chemotaxis signal transduction protein